MKLVFKKSKQGILYFIHKKKANIIDCGRLKCDNCEIASRSEECETFLGRVNKAGNKIGLLYLFSKRF